MLKLASGMDTVPPVETVKFEHVVVPVNEGPARFAFKFKAVCVAVDTGLLASEVLLQFPSPTMAAVIPETVPVKLGDAKFAFRLRAVCVAVDTGLLASLVLFTFPSPICEGLMLLTVGLIPTSGHDAANVPE